MAVDVSESVDADEYILQHEGIARAFDNPILAAAVAAGRIGAIEVAVLEWVRSRQAGGDGRLEPGRRRGERRGLRQESARLAGAVPNGLTAIGDALLAAPPVARRRPPDPADRRMVDLSGDGIANIGPPVRDVRDELVAAGITINGLAILASEPWLESYYDEYVIGGPRRLPAAGRRVRILRHRHAEQIAQRDLRTAANDENGRRKHDVSTTYNRHART